MAILNSPYIAVNELLGWGNGIAYEIRAKNGGCLGRIEWFTRWRCYEFNPEPGTGYDAKCLTAIADFLQQLNEEHKAKP